MSKSLGNIMTVRELVQGEHSPRVLRYALLSAHYRQQVNVSAETLDGARRALERLDTLYQAALDASGSEAVRGELSAASEAARVRFTEALADDLGIAGALAALYDLVSEVHRLSRERTLSRSEGELLLELWRDADRVLGFLIPLEEELPAEVEREARQRLVFRQERQFGRADEIRRRLAEQGFILEDSQSGSLVIWGKGRKMINFPQQIA